MQSETLDFALGAATWRSGWNIRVVFDSAYSLITWKLYRHRLTSSFSRADLFVDATL